MNLRRGTRRAPRATRTRTIAISGAVAVALVVAGVAFATWIVSGEGSGPVSSASIQPLSVDVAGVSNLYPGATLQSDVSVSNPNPYPVVVITIQGRADSDCYSTSPEQPPAGTTIPAASTSNGSTQAGKLDVKVDFSMPQTAPQTCAGQQYTGSVQVSATTDH